MSASLVEILPTLIGAAVFVMLAVGILAALSAIASRIEDRLQGQETTTDIGIDRQSEVSNIRAA